LMSSAGEKPSIGMRFRLLDILTLLMAIALAECSPCADLAQADTSYHPDASGENQDLSVYPYDQTLVSDHWEYQYIVSLRGSMSEGAFGNLLYDGVEVPTPDMVNDYYLTPWGNMYWVGDEIMPWGEHGWMDHPDAYRPEGHQLPDPATSIIGTSLEASRVEPFGLYDTLITDGAALTPACHPADVDCDWQIDAQELVVYGAAWMEGLERQSGQSSVDSGFVARAVYIWSTGGGYCNTGTEPPQCWEAFNPSCILLDESDNGSIVSVRLGTELQISLRANATTGYMWEVTSCDEAILTKASECYQCDDLEADGAPGTSTFRFTAIAPGRTVIELENYPGDTFEVDVIVQ
jgi:predicted secreted protein